MQADGWIANSLIEAAKAKTRKDQEWYANRFAHSHWRSGLWVHFKTRHEDCHYTSLETQLDHNECCVHGMFQMSDISAPIMH